MSKHTPKYTIRTLWKKYIIENKIDIFFHSGEGLGKAETVIKTEGPLQYIKSHNFLKS